MIKNYFIFLMVCLTLCYGSLLSAQGGADCASAVAITPGAQVAAGPTGAQGSCNTGTAGEWYSYTAIEDGAVTVASCFGGADTKVNIYDACGAANCIAGNDDACLIEEGSTQTFASSASWNTIAGTTYYIEWDDRWDTNGFDWTLELSESVFPPGCASYTFPADGAVDVVIDESLVDSRITFTWELSSEGSPDEGINVYLGAAPDALNLLGAYPAGATSGAITSISYSTTYYWAMVPFNSEGEATDCEIFSFTTGPSDVDVPNCATLVTPADGTIDVPVSDDPNEAVDFAWLFATDGEAATGGNFYLGTAPDALTFIGTVTSATEATPVDGFALGTTYHWQLVPTTAGGEAVDCPIYSFTTETPIGDPGCTDETACNYDPSAGVDDGSCFSIGDACDDEDPLTIGDVYVSCDLCQGETEVFPGCTDEEACNYNAAANSDDGSCFSIGDTCDDEDPLTIGDVYVSCDLCEGETEVFPGCTDEEACNYNAAANSDDGSCFSIGDACDDEDPLTIGDVYVSCDLCEGETEVFPGCTDEEACNYNAAANSDDGSCFSIGDACDDEDPLTIGDVYVSCDLCEGETEVFPGCTDEEACNYNAAANSDDGSCFSIGDACDDGNELTSGDVYISCDVCQGIVDEIPGCTDEAACNYNADATEDDGSCIVPTGCDFCFEGELVDNPEVGDACDDGNELTSNDVITNCDGDCAGVIDPVLGCTDATACNYDEAANSDDGSCTYVLGCDVCVDGVVIDNPEIGEACDDGNELTTNDVITNCDGDCAGVIDPVLGCTDSSACNYDEAANSDDGSCTYALGCDVCVDGVVIDNPEIGEACDDGNELTSNDVITNCDGDCAGVIDPVLGCTDATACNYDEAANSDDGSCTYALGCDVCVDGMVIDNPEIGEACDDGNVDTENDVILEDCSCAGTLIGDCDDENACTIDTMNDAGECVYTDVDCDDGDFCTIDSCDPVAGCVNTAIDCNDDNPLTTDSCDPAIGCVYIDVFCDDENACTIDTMNDAGDCVYTDVDCDDGDLCTIDSCDPTTGCVNIPIDCDDGDPLTEDSCIEGLCVNTPIGDCETVTPTMWGTGPWAMVTHGTFVAESSNDAILAKGDGDLMIEVFLGECGGTSIGIFNTVVAGEGSPFIERIVVGDLIAGQTYSYTVSGGTNIMSKVKTYANGMLRADECPGTRELSEKIHALRENQMYTNPAVQVTGFTFRFEDLADGDVFVAVRNTVDGHSPQLSAISGLESGHTYNVQVAHRVLQVANGMVAELYSDYGTSCTLTIGEGVAPVFGCTDATACNYNDAANSDDGSCVSAEGCDTCSGQTDGTGTVVDNPDIGDACDDGDAGTENDMIVDCNECAGTIIGEIPGCADAAACNFNNAASVDDGSCVFAEGCDACSGEQDGTGTVIDNLEVGEACDDGFLESTNDIVGDDCVCAGTFPPATDSCGAYSNSPGTVIADNATITDDIVVSGTGETLADLNVAIDINHTWMSDLVINLIAPDLSVINLYDPTTSCSQDNMNALFDDDGEAAPCNTSGAGDAPQLEAVDGIVLPLSALAALNGTAFDGTWTLEVTDGAGGDPGVLVQWCLIPTFDAGIVDNDNQSGLPATEMEIKALIFPNPNTGENVNVTLSNLNDADEMVTIEVMDVYGKKVYSETYAINGSTMRQELVFNNDLASGLYLVQISANGQSVTQKLTIK